MINQASAYTHPQQQNLQPHQLQQGIPQQPQPIIHHLPTHQQMMGQPTAQMAGQPFYPQQIQPHQHLQQQHQQVTFSST